MSESEDPKISIFPPEKVNEYLCDKSLPEFLRHQDNENFPTSYQNFFKRNQETLSFLERNAIENNPFKIQAESFEFHFQELRRLYSVIYTQSSPLSEEDHFNLLKLLRYERSIHDICEFSATQDVSIYLTILQRIFDDENSLLELISLMNKKHLTWDDRLSPAYLNWMHFLTPFLHYIHSNSKDLTTVNLDEKIMDCLKQLDESLVAKELGKKFSELDPKDHQVVKQIILSLKKNPNLSKIKDYYNVLGICVLFQSLMKFQNSPPNFGFLRLCAQIAIYSNKLYQFERKEMQDFLGASDFSALIIKGDFYIEIITQLLSSNTKEHLGFQKQVLLEVLYSLATNDLCEAKHFEGSLLEEISDFIMESNRQQQDFKGWLISDNEYLLWSYLLIIKQLFVKSSEREQLCQLIFNKLPILIKSEGPRRLLILYIYHQLQMLAVCANEKNVIPEIPQQDLESVVQNFSSFFDRVIVFAQINSEDITTFENFTSQSLSKIAQVFLKPFLTTKEKTPILESCFDKSLINQDLTSYRIIAFLNLITALEKFFPEKNMIFRFLLQNPKLWSMLMNSLKLLIKENQLPRVLIAKKLKDFIKSLEKLFHVEASKTTLTEKLGYSLPVDQVIRDLITSLNNEFESFPLYEMLAINNADLNQSFTSILEIYEKSIYFYGKINAIVIEEIHSSIQTYDLELIRYRRKKFGEKGYAVEAVCLGTLFRDEEDFEQEEIPKAAQPRDAEEKRLMDKIETERERLKEIQKLQIEDIKSRISGKIQEFGVIFLFKGLAKAFKPYQKSCLSIILQSLNSLFDEIIGQNPESFLREISEEVKELPRIQTTDDKNFNQIITLDLYLNLLLKFLAHYSIQDELFKSEQFIWNLHSTVTTLFTNLLNQVPQQIPLLDFTQFFQDIFDTFVSYFSYKLHQKEKLTSDQSLKLLQWAQIFFKTCKLLLPSFTISSDIKVINLIQIALKSDPQTSCSFLIDQPEVLKTILCSRQFQPWSLDLTKEISFIFSTFLQSSLPNDKGVILKLNTLLTKHHYSLRLLANNPIIQQQEALSAENLVALLENNFDIQICSTARGKSQLAPDNILVRFDPTKVTKTLEETVSDIISNMSIFSKRIIDVLIDSLVENHCENFRIISEETNKGRLKKEDFKETSSIFTILMTLFQSYPQALVYAALRKNDFPSTKQLTFFEILFEINYFSFNDNDMLGLAKVLFSLNSGVLFSDNRQTRDIYEILVFDFMTLINQNLQKQREISPTSSWETLEKCLFIFTATGITYEMQKYSTYTDTWRALIRTDLKSLFNTLLGNILTEINFLVKNYYNLTNKWSHLDNFLFNLIKQHFNQIIQDAKLSIESFDSLKVNHYISFLQVDSQETPQDFSFKLLQKMDIQQSASFQKSYPEYIQNATMSLPLIESFSTFAPEQWKSKITIFGKNLKSNDSLVKNFIFYKRSTALTLVGEKLYSSQIPDSKLPQWQISGESVFVDITLKCHEILSKKLQATNFVCNNKPAIPLNNPLSNPIQSRKINYFLHPTLQNYAEFLSIKSRVIMLLKDTSERVLVAQLTNSNHKDSIEAELKSSLKNLSSEFESNLLLCLVDQFEVLKLYTPEIKNLTNIQEELLWIETNFDSYLNFLRGNETTQPSQNLKISLEEFPMTNNATFCTTAADIPSGAKEHPTKSQQLDEQYYSLKDFDFSDDKIIESFLLLFVRNNPGDIYSEIPNMMKLLEYLCYSPKFEIKLFDLLFFILYCPESIKNTLNLDDPDETLTHNILLFFNNYLPKKPAIIYQPRIFLEQYGFKPLEKLKLDHKFYQEQISSKISILDLLIGLLDIPDLQIPHHQKLIFSCLNTLLQKNEALQIVEPQHLKNLEHLRVLTIASCNLMAKHENLQSVLFQFPDFVLYNWKNVIQIKFQDQLDLMYHPVKGLNARISNSQGEPKVLDELNSIKEIEPKFEEMEKRLDLANFILTKMFLYPSDATVDYSQKALKSVDQILADGLVQEFFTNLFELASYLVGTAIDLKLHVLFLCIHFYTLLCIMRMACGLEKVPLESIDELKHVPELEKTFSSMVRENKFDFDILFADLCKKYQTVIANQIFVKPNLKKQFTIICRRMPWCIDFVTKKKILADNITKSFHEQEISTSHRNINIDRTEFLKTTFKAFSRQTKHDLCRPIRIKYIDEPGYDVGGLSREFFTNIAGELFDPRMGLFQLSPNQTNIQPGSTAKIIDGHLKYFELAGILLSKAIQQDCIMDLNFTKSFLKQILRRRILLDDLEDYESDLAKNLKWMLNNPVEGLEQSFTFENQLFDQNTTIELIPNGYNIIVNDENKNDFVTKVCEMKLHQQIADEILSFLKGFYHVMPVDALEIFSASEFQILIAGIPTIRVEDMKKNAIFSCFTSEVEYLKDWLWEILFEFSQKELAAFLFFTSGSLKPPGGGFAEKPIRFKYMGDFPLRLSIAHTCSWELEIAKYASREDFKHKLLMAIFDGQGSFMLG